MKKFDFRFLLLSVLSLLIISSCGDKDGVSPFIGNYTIEKAFVVVPVEINVIQNGTGVEFTYFLNDTNITNVIKPTIFGGLNSCSGDSIMELQEDGKMVLSCSGGASIDAGTWTENDKEIKLEFKAQAVPSIPDGFTMTLTSPKMNNGVMTSNASMVVPKETVAALVEQSGLAVLSDNNPDLFNFTFSFELKSTN